MVFSDMWWVFLDHITFLKHEVALSIGIYPKTWPVNLTLGKSGNKLTLFTLCHYVPMIITNASE